MTNKPILGTLVKYTSAFLRSTGQYTNVPKDGQVVDTETAIGPEFVVVQWCDRDEAVLVHIHNIMPADAPDQG